MGDQHTKGPWTVERRELSSLIWGKGANGYLAVVHQFSGSMNPKADEATANARLIAAAPDFLSSSKSLIEAWDARKTVAQQIVTGKSDADLQKQAMAAIEGLRAAIAKATSPALPEPTEGKLK